MKLLYPKILNKDNIGVILYLAGSIALYFNLLKHRKANQKHGMYVALFILISIFLIIEYA